MNFKNAVKIVVSCIRHNRADNEVMIIPVEKHSDGYMVAEVMAYGKGEADISFQEELLKNGLAKTRKSEVECLNQLAFEQAQKMAIASKAGVWKQSRKPLVVGGSPNQCAVKNLPSANAGD